MPAKRFTPAPAAPTFVERTDLPRLYVQGKGQVRYAAYVQCSIAGKATTVKSVEVTPIYFLSLVARRGSGNVLWGLWSALIARHPEEVYLDGVGRIVLAHHALNDLRWTLHWNYHQTAVETGDLHALIESHMLTIYDPVRAAAAPERSQRKRAPASLRKAPKTGKEESATMTKKDAADEDEQERRQKHPLFLLRVPGSVQPRRHDGEVEQAYAQRCQQTVQTYRQQLHFAFLDRRIPWPCAPEWAPYLWERGVARNEILPLTVWSPSVPQAMNDGHEDRDKQQASTFALPTYLEAWLCRPDPIQLWQDLRLAKAEGKLIFPATVLQQQLERELAGSFS